MGSPSITVVHLANMTSGPLQVSNGGAGNSCKSVFARLPRPAPECRQPGWIVLGPQCSNVLDQMRNFADPVIVGEVIGKDWDPVKGTWS